MAQRSALEFAAHRLGIDPRLNFPEQPRWAGRLSADRTFPDYKGSPAEDCKSCKGRCPSLWFGKFSPPEFADPPFEKMAVMAVPEAPVDENHNLSPGHRYVGLSRKFFVVQSVAITPGIQSFSYCQLRLGILAPYTGHHFRSFFFVYYVYHKLCDVVGQMISWFTGCDSKPNMLIL